MVLETCGSRKSFNGRYVRVAVKSIGVGDERPDLFRRGLEIKFPTIVEVAHQAGIRSLEKLCSGCFASTSGSIRTVGLRRIAFLNFIMRQPRFSGVPCPCVENIEIVEQVFDFGANRD